MPAFEEFHITASEDASRSLAALLRTAAIRIQESARKEGGRTWYIIATHPDDLEAANDLFLKDVGPGRTFTSGGMG